MSEAMSRQNAMSFLRKEIDEATAALDKWKKERLEVDPCYAFEWGDGAFEAAAKIRVFSYYLKAFEGNPELTWYEAMNYAKDEVLQRAPSPPRPSSPTRNIMERLLLGVHARIAGLDRRLG